MKVDLLVKSVARFQMMMMWGHLPWPYHEEHLPKTHHHLLADRFHVSHSFIHQHIFPGLAFHLPKFSQTQTAPELHPPSYWVNSGGAKMSSPILQGYLDAILTHLRGFKKLFTYLMCRHDSKVLQHDQNLQLLFH